MHHSADTLDTLDIFCKPKAKVPMLSSDNVVTQAKKATPWSAPWWVSLLEGVILAALGIYLIVSPDKAVLIFGRAVALYLFIAGLIQTLAGLQKTQTDMAGKLALWRGIIGLVLGGAVVILSFVFQWLSPQTSLWLLAAGTFLYGLIGLYLAFAQKTRGSGRLLALVGSILFIVVGFTALFLQGRSVVDGWIGPTFTVLGIGLVIFAFIRRSQQQDAKEAARESTVATKSAAAAHPVATTAPGTSAAPTAEGAASAKPPESGSASST